MQITAQMVKELRELTGAGMMDCKNALIEKEGNIDAAVDFLREKGLGKAAKKVDRLAAEGLISLYIEGNKAVLTEINSETDFVAKNQNFVDLCNKVTKHAFDNNITDVEVLKASKIDGVDFEEFFKGQIAQIGENLVVRRIATLEGCEHSMIHGYLHFNGKVGAIIKVEVDNHEAGEKIRDFVNSLCMHISAMSPRFMDYTDLTAEFVEKETLALKADIEKENEEALRLGKNLKHIPEYGSMVQLTPEVMAAAEEKFKEELKAEGKPEKIWDKILPGKMHRFVLDNTQVDQTYCLNSQHFILEDSMTVKEVVEKKAAELGMTIKVLDYIRLEVGEGIEKKACNFADEVAEQLNR